jgi:hypothetical protein
MAERLDRGERERQTAHIAFESMETFLKVLAPNRWALLDPCELARPGGQTSNSLLETLVGWSKHLDSHSPSKGQTHAILSQATALKSNSARITS